MSMPVKTSSGFQSSATWTSTSGDLGILSDTDELGDRQEFVDEYNRLAQKVCSSVPASWTLSLTS